MTNGEDLQEVLRQNLRVLLAIRRMSHAELAARLGTDRATVTKNMNGHRKWSLQDLATLGEIFGVNAPSLIGDVSELIQAMGPTRVATGTDHQVSSRANARYQGANDAQIIPFPQVGLAAQCYHGDSMINAGEGADGQSTSWNTGHLIAEPVA
jgi:transcriptional regulator with XRE-family HTH domain